MICYFKAKTQSLCDLDIGNLDIVYTSRPAPIFSRKILFVLSKPLSVTADSDGFLNCAFQSHFWACDIKLRLQAETGAVAQKKNDQAIAHNGEHLTVGTVQKKWRKIPENSMKKQVELG